MGVSHVTLTCQGGPGRKQWRASGFSWVSGRQAKDLEGFTERDYLHPEWLGSDAVQGESSLL